MTRPPLQTLCSENSRLAREVSPRRVGLTPSGDSRLRAVRARDAFRQGFGYAADEGWNKEGRARVYRGWRAG